MVFLFDQERIFSCEGYGREVVKEELIGDTGGWQLLRQIDCLSGQDYFLGNYKVVF